VGSPGFGVGTGVNVSVAVEVGVDVAGVSSAGTEVTEEAWATFVADENNTMVGVFREEVKVEEISGARGVLVGVGVNAGRPRRKQPVTRKTNMPAVNIVNVNKPTSDMARDGFTHSPPNWYASSALTFAELGSCSNYTTTLIVVKCSRDDSYPAMTITLYYNFAADKLENG
jgi:hypothetical protein